jgi:acetyl-CoA carboxylase biotin carboxyl carrier protein
MSKFDIDEALIRKLAKLLKETGLTEIEYDTDDARIRVSAAAAGTVVAAAPAAVAPAAAPAALAPAAPTADAPAAGSVSSPMVGTAYLSPEPNAAAFVKVGDRIAKGQTILIIEAMKTMNHIPAPHAGTVLAVLVDDGQPVEYAEPLAVIERG